MAVDLLLHRGLRLARAWLDEWSEDAAFVTGFLLLRPWHRRQHGELCDPVLVDALRLVSPEA